METIEFQNKQYPVREIKFPKVGEVLISTTSLNEALLKKGNYVSENAVIIDELLNETSKNDPIHKQNILNFIERYLSKRTS